MVPYPRNPDGAVRLTTYVIEGPVMEATGSHLAAIPGQDQSRRQLRLSLSTSSCPSRQMAAGKTNTFSSEGPQAAEGTLPHCIDLSVRNMI
jgi:hypothetical protein